MLVGAHPLDAHGFTAHRARKQCGVAGRVFVAIAAVAARTFEVEAVHVVEWNIHHCGELFSKPVRRLRGAPTREPAVFYFDADPLHFRLSHLKDPRAAELLTRLAALAKWEKRPSPRNNGQSDDVVVGRGISYMKEIPTPTYVGAVAEIEVDRRNGEIRVQRFFVAHDCGQVINPDGVVNQIEGNVIQTVSRTLKEEVLFDRSAVTSLHWGTYPILTFPEVPDVVVELIDGPTVAPSGAGEPAAGVVPSAISNAVFDALGVRLRSVPFTPAKVMAALDGH